MGDIGGRQQAHLFHADDENPTEAAGLDAEDRIVKGHGG